MTSSEIRRQFFEFFQSKNHKIVQGGPVVPFEDPTLMFTNAGMNQFKDVFLGVGKRDYTRAANTQKCIRVSGKHNDLEEVGFDTYHHTLFEMLGNWSFGDYYKAEAIEWAWELLTNVWKLPKERLYATVYRTDDESIELWKTKTDINPAHILKFDEKDNFWEMGETGPCGPCSEIHINLTDDYDNPKYVNTGTPECIEIWNLVFIQYNRDQNGVLHELPSKHVDTGMGFERLVAVMQNKSSNYDTDVFMPLINQITEYSGIPYLTDEDKISTRVIADHIRTLSFAIADGVVPGNEGRGYVLRRILRRAARYGRKLNLKEPFLYKLVDILSSTMGDVFPEITAKLELVKKVIRSEEESFNRTLDRGMEKFAEIAAALRASENMVVPGSDAFKLYDTFGFPLDLTQVLARESGFTVDEAGFTELMKEQRDRARAATKDKTINVQVQINNLDDFALEGKDKTIFTGHTELSSKSIIIGKKKDAVLDLIILDKSPFYVEAGGQIDDTGTIAIGDWQLEVVDVTKINNTTVHVIKNDSDFALETGMEVLAAVDSKRRWDITRNHSATHFLHSALQKILGSHVQQAGSYVGPDRFRFDFSHFSKVSESELTDIEILVNEELRKNIPLQHHRDMPFEEAKLIGAKMFFGDKYGDFVNVVQFGDFSIEFCGGTHTQNSSQIGLIKIVSEASISSGIRRIEGVSGAGVEKYLTAQIEKGKQAQQHIDELIDQKKKLEKELQKARFKDKIASLDILISSAKKIGNIPFITGKISAESNEEMLSFGTELRAKIKSGIGLLISEIDGKVGLVCAVTDDLIKEKKLNAGKIVGDIAKLLGGGGGGKPQVATAGAKDITKIDFALSEAPKIISGYLE